MVVHMTAAPGGCGLDMYILMRPEMVHGKVCFISECYYCSVMSALPHTYTQTLSALIHPKQRELQLSPEDIEKGFKYIPV